MDIEKLNKVKEYIRENGLSKKSRKRKLVDKRSYLYKYLILNTELSLTSIGNMFNRRHATVINGLKNFDRLKGDKCYIYNVYVVSKDFPILSESKQTPWENKRIVSEINRKDYLKLSQFRFDNELDTDEQAIKLLIDSIIH